MESVDVKPNVPITKSGQSIYPEQQKAPLQQLGLEGTGFLRSNARHLAEGVASNLRPLITSGSVVCGLISTISQLLCL